MIYLAYLIFAFSVVQLLVALSNLVCKQKLKNSNSAFDGLVSIVIPARNEEITIGNLLSDLQKQDYANIEIIVFNDQSTDRTAAIVNEYAAIDTRIKLINSDVLPTGWLGKNHACFTASKHANGDYLLFLDADVRVRDAVILNTVALAEKHTLGLLSVFPQQQMHSLGERLTVPNMNFILLSLLPLGLVLKSKFPSLAAANGQFMLFNAQVYAKTNPHDRFKNNKVEDIEIARYFKQNDIAIACLTGDNSITCRMYSGFDEAVNGFSKNVINYFGNSFALATFFCLITTFGIIPILLCLTPLMILLYLSTVIAIRIIISIVSKQNILLNIFLVLPQQIAMGLFVYKAFMNTFNNTYQWKGRNIS